ncbi:MAG TPA: AAA family ATPase, partial [Nannocystaceae bacterium]|nr:AAA family ATPase [Nannocystaceae bacterium]
MADAIELEPLIVLRTRASGSVYAYPLADPSLVCRTRSVDEALALQATFLAEHLARVPADRLAAFVYPPETTLHDVAVLVPRDDLQRRFGVTRPLAIPCVCVPDDDGARWVHVLPLGHMVYLREGEDLERRVVDEVLRWVGAREPEPRDWLAMLPADRHAIVRITVKVERGTHDDLGNRAAARREREQERTKKEARELLASIGTDVLTERARKKGPQVVGRDGEIRRLAALLSGRDRLAVTLVGKPSSGKSAVFDGLLSQRVVEFRAHPVYATAGARLVAGQSGFGQLQERLDQVMRAAEALDAILYFDNFGDLFAGKSGGIEDLAALIRPWVVQGRVRIVGELTADALEHHEKRHFGLLSAMHRIPIEPLDAGTTKTLLLARAEHARQRDPERPSIAAAAIEPLVELAERYLVDQAFPGKAVRMLDELRAIHEHDVTADGRPYVIGVHDVHRAFSLRTGIPMFLLREDQRMRRQALEDEFRRRVIGQHEAIRRVVETLCTIKARLQPPGKPLAVFLFIGPTGVGKTEVGKTLARVLFGATERLVRFDMSEYADPFAAERLIRGNDRGDGELTRKVRQQPFCVVLLDEIEKAHPAVFDLLLQVCGEGRLTDARGQTTSFHNAIVIMTSNLGAAHRPRARSGAGFAAGTSAETDADAERRYYLEQVDRHFRPEFVNRLDRVIPFTALGREEIASVAEVSLARIRERAGFVQRGLQLHVTDAARARVAELGYSPIYGARALRRHLEDGLVAPIARLVSGVGADADGGLVVASTGAEDLTSALASIAAVAPTVTAEHEGLHIAFVRRTDRRAVVHSRLLADISHRRRTAASCLQLALVDGMRQRLAYLTADLATGDSRTAAAGVREHQRLTEALASVDAALRTLETIEELAMVASASGESTGEYLADADRAFADFEVAFVHAATSVEPSDRITLFARPLDSTPPMLAWLRFVADLCEDRGWTLVVHRWNDGEGAPDWP